MIEAISPREASSYISDIRRVLSEHMSSDQLVNSYINDPTDTKVVKKLAQLVSVCPVSMLAENSRKGLYEMLEPIESDIPFQIKPAFSTTSAEGYTEDWWLCSNAEPRIETAQRNNMLLAVSATTLDGNAEDIIAIKSIGRLVGLCLKSAVTPDGTMFIEGVWYAPTNRKVRDRIRLDIDQGIGRRSGSDSIDWVVQRACDVPFFHMLSPLMRAGLQDFYDTPDPTTRCDMRRRIRDDYVASTT